MNKKLLITIVLAFVLLNSYAKAEKSTREISESPFIFSKSLDYKITSRIRKKKKKTKAHYLDRQRKLSLWQYGSNCS